MPIKPLLASAAVLLLVRYGEIGIKSPPVRRRFELRLSENVKTMLARERVECVVRRDRGRLFVSVADDEATLARAESALRRTFGVVSFSRVRECASKMEDMEKLAVELAAAWPSCSFAIRARRAGTHSYTSRDVAVALGRAIQGSAGERKLDVDLDSPQRDLEVEVREKRAFLFESRVTGPGGLPVGSQGKVAAVVRDGEDAAAAWLILKRGCGLIASGDETWITRLERWAPSIKRLPGRDEKHPSGEDDLTSMFHRGAEASVSGEKEPLAVATGKTPRGRLVLHPLVGLSELEIRELLGRLESPP